MQKKRKVSNQNENGEADEVNTELKLSQIFRALFF